jgi:hypothetical protein
VSSVDANTFNLRRKTRGERKTISLRKDRERDSQSPTTTEGTLITMYIYISTRKCKLKRKNRTKDKGKEPLKKVLFRKNVFRQDVVRCLKRNRIVEMYTNTISMNGG